jgi:hypothetical protein
MHVTDESDIPKFEQRLTNSVKINHSKISTVTEARVVLNSNKNTVNNGRKPETNLEMKQCQVNMAKCDSRSNVVRLTQSPSSKLSPAQKTENTSIEKKNKSVSFIPALTPASAQKLKALKIDIEDMIDCKVVLTRCDPKLDALHMGIFDPVTKNIRLNMFSKEDQQILK